MFWFMGQSLTGVIIGVLTRIFIIMAVMPVHEAAHAWAANKLGDPTARFNGRLTLNPLSHINYIGAAMIMLFGFGWANPVPVNPYNFRNQSKRREGMALTAAAGPASNLIMAIVFMFLLRAVLAINITSMAVYKIVVWVVYALQVIVSINLSLAVFNLLPIHPLDGSRILAVFLPERWNEAIERNGQVLSMVLMALVFFGAFGGIVSGVVNGLYNGMWTAVDWLFSAVGL